jgi:tRNA threonylcarbamoyladenosine biosynthesis protein TsaE
MNSKDLQVRVATAELMESLGGALGAVLLSPPEKGPDRSTRERAALVFLRGPLGAVKSPTYTLVEPYSTEHGRLAHFDFYRLSTAEEVEYLGLRDYLDYDVCLFEWPERARGAVSMPDLDLGIEVDGEARKVRISAQEAWGTALLERLEPSGVCQETTSDTCIKLRNVLDN